jgi:acetoin utilization deacetylase AcuC-like enzyme
MDQGMEDALEHDLGELEQELSPRSGTTISSAPDVAQVKPEAVPAETSEAQTITSAPDASQANFETMAAESEVQVKPEAVAVAAEGVSQVKPEAVSAAASISDTLVGEKQTAMPPPSARKSPGRLNLTSLTIPAPLPQIRTTPTTPVTVKSQRRTALHKFVVDLDLGQLRAALTPKSPLLHDINVQEEHGYTPLMSASALGSQVSSEVMTEIGKLLLDHGANIAARDKEGFTALHWAAAVDNATMSELLLGLGAEKDAVSKTGDTPLHRASMMGRSNCVRSLIVAGVSTSLRNDQGHTALAAAGSYCGKDTPLNRNRVREAFFSAARVRTLVLHHPLCKGHMGNNAGLHQESPLRIDAGLDMLQEAVKQGAVPQDEFEWRSDFPPAKDEVVLRAHSAEYLSFVKQLAAQVQQHGQAVPFTPRVQEGVCGTPPEKLKAKEFSDTIFSKGTMPAALMAAGAGVHAVDEVVSGRHRNAFCLVRPPGHHAGVMGLLHDAVSCGFCILNNICMAAMHALEAHSDKIQRVAIVDFDVSTTHPSQYHFHLLRPHITPSLHSKVHHGNGTEEIIRTKIKQPNKLFFASMHLYDNDKSDKDAYAFYPGSGEHDVLEQNIVNVAIAPLWRKDKKTPGGGHGGHSNRGHAKDTLPKMSGRHAYRQLTAQRVIPALRAFNPDLILVSAGYDGSRHDIGNANLTTRAPGLDLTPADFNWLVQQLNNVAEICCEGRIIVMLEGGYGRYAGSSVDLREFGLNCAMSVAALLGRTSKADNTNLTSLSSSMQSPAAKKSAKKDAAKKDAAKKEAANGEKVGSSKRKRSDADKGADDIPTPKLKTAASRLQEQEIPPALPSPTSWRVDRILKHRKAKKGA